MREILFRGKRTDNGEWVEGYVAKRPDAIQFEEGPYSPWYIDKPPKDPDDYGGVYSIDPETVGQFTGLEDRNGARIFEGDVVMLIFTSGQHKGKVVFHNGGFCVEALENFVSLQKTPVYEFERLGNIHDNPELLEKEDGE